MRILCPFKPRPRQHMIREVGSRRIERELDITRFIRNQSIIRAILRSKTTKKERALARRNYRLIVDSSSEQHTTSSSSTTDDDIHFTKDEAMRDYPLLF
jgi:hypothetical protein